MDLAAQFNSLSEASEDRLAELWASLEGYKRAINEIDERLKAEMTLRLGESKAIRLGEYKATKSKVFRKVFAKPIAEIMGTPDEKFVKVEYKPNQATITEYKKQNKKLPDIITEVYGYETLRVAKVSEPKPELQTDPTIALQSQEWLKRMKGN
jgi:t-SNARE complex subunit (syntaxin)